MKRTEGKTESREEDTSSGILLSFWIQPCLKLAISTGFSDLWANKWWWQCWCKMLMMTAWVTASWQNVCWGVPPGRPSGWRHSLPQQPWVLPADTSAVTLSRMKLCDPRWCPLPRSSSLLLTDQCRGTHAQTPVSQFQTTLKDYPRSGFPHRTDWGLWCNWTAVQPCLCLPLPPSLTLQCCPQQESPINSLHADLHLGVCLLGSFIWDSGASAFITKGILTNMQSHKSQPKCHFFHQNVNISASCWAPGACYLHLHFDLLSPPHITVDGPCVCLPLQNCKHSKSFLCLLGPTLLQPPQFMLIINRGVTMRSSL